MGKALGLEIVKNWSKPSRVEPSETKNSDDTSSGCTTPMTSWPPLTTPISGKLRTKYMGRSAVMATSADTWAATPLATVVPALARPREHAAMAAELADTSDTLMVTRDRAPMGQLLTTGEDEPSTRYFTVIVPALFSVLRTEMNSRKSGRPLPSAKAICDGDVAGRRAPGLSVAPLTTPSPAPKS